MPKPPVNNQGAETSSAPVVKPEENRILIDFLSWTLKVLDPLEALTLSGFDVNLFTQTDIGGNGYKRSYRYGNIVCFYDGSESMGCHVSMTGQGCRQFETISHTEYCWDYLLKDLHHVGATFTRLDLAIDNIDGKLSLDKLKKAVLSKSIRTRFKESVEFQKHHLSRKTAGHGGHTLQFGSKFSRTSVIFYDKAAEQADKHDMPVGSLGHWVRCELKLSKERAQVAVDLLLSGMTVSYLAVSVLNNYLAVVKVTEENLSRCRLAGWWFQWLETTDKLKLSVIKAQRFVLDSMRHVEKQYSATFAMIKKHLGVSAFHSFFNDLIEDGKDKLGKKHQLILAASRPAPPLCELPF